MCTCAARVQTDDLETAVCAVSSQIGTCAVGIAIWASETLEGGLAVGVGEGGDDAS